MSNFNNEGLIVEIIVREASGAKIETHKFKLRDANKTYSTLGLLKKKYGFNDFSKRDSDMDWLK